MRFLHANRSGGFSLMEYVGKNIPTYAILSHTWGPDRDELTYRDLSEGTGQEKKGYTKLKLCSQWAARDNIEFFWIDTCCIDKSSSAELSEAINSMFKWYHESAKCYVYLPDVSRTGALGTGNEFRRSRWFTRGWTLQELVAPKVVEFFCSDGTILGDRISLMEPICMITGIPVTALGGGALHTFPIEERLSWSRGRQTKREEDAAYSLLGLFDILMPLLYGEGKDRALARLRREIDSSPTGSAQATANGSDVHQINAALRKAVEIGNISTARRSLQEGADVHSTDHLMRTPLHIACLHGTPRMVRLLLDHEARLEDMDIALVQPLHLAASRGDIEILQTMFTHHLDAAKTEIDVGDGDGNTPLHRSILAGHTDTSRLLLSVGANIYIKNKNGQNSLRLSRNLRRQDMSDLVRGYQREDVLSSQSDARIIAAAEQGDLLRLENYLDSYALRGSVALVAAANHGHIEAVNLLVDHISDTDSTGHGLSDALHAVADCDSSETGLLIMRNLLDKGAVASGTYGEDALITAMTRDRRDMVQLLFRHGVQQSSKIEAVVSSAIESGQLDLVRLAAEHEVPLVPHEYSDVLRLKSGDDQEMWKLLRKRARGFPGKYQITQIVRAVRLDFIQQLLEDTSEDLSDKFDMSAMIAGNHFEFVKALLERGAKPTWNTDISPAVAGHQFELVEMLLPNVKYNPSSFEVAVNTCQSDMLDLMTKHASEEAFRLFQDFIPRLVAQNQPEKLMLLLKHQPSCGAWLNSVNSELLRRPVARGWLDLVRLLLEHGARPWAGTLLRAVTNDHVEMVTLLIKHGASVDVHRERFVYALGAAAARGGPNFEVIASMLLGKGADINMIDKDNRSALGEAVKYGHENVVRYLLQRGAYPTGTEDPYQGSSCDVNPHEMARRKSRIEPERYTTIFKLLDNEVKLAKTKLAKKYKEERANMTLWTKVKSYWQ